MKRQFRLARPAATALFAMVLVLGWTTVPASPVSATVPDRQVVTANSPSTSDNKGVTVTCPTGTQRLASGADLSGVGSAYVIIDDLIPGPRNVHAHGYEYEYGTAATWTITVWAVCGRLSTSVYTYSRTSGSTSDFSESKNVTVTCPSPMVVLGTGFELKSALGFALVHEVTPTATSVNVEAYAVDVGTAGGWSLTAYAICALDPGGRSQVSATTSSNSDYDKNGSVTCPTGKEAFGTGFDLNGFKGRLNIDDLIPTSVGTVLTHANELVATTNTWSLTTYAICANA